MRLSLPDWRRLHWLGIEPPVVTNVDGGASGNIATGNFQGGSGGNVTINYGSRRIRGRRPRREPRSEKKYAKAMWTILLEDQRERRIRQLEADARYAETRESRAAMWRWIVGIAVIVGLLAVLIGSLFWQFQTRFGFL